MTDRGFDVTPEIQQAFEALPNAVGIYECRGREIIPRYFNGMFLHMFGYDSAEEALTAHYEIYQDVHPDDIGWLLERAYAFYREDKAYDVVYRSKGRDRENYHFIHAAGKIICREGKKYAVISYAEEDKIFSGGERSAEEKENSLARTIVSESEQHKNQFDDLTGLPSADCFFRTVPDIIRKMKEQQQTPVVLYVNFSGMKDYNAMHGFQEGDALIAGLGRLLRECFGTMRVCRFDADHFVVCAEKSALKESEDFLFAQARRLNQGNSLPVLIGIYDYSSGEVSLSVACDRASLACGSLKDASHSSVAVFDRGMQSAHDLRKYVVRNFERAMREGWLQVYYQPVIRTVTGMLCGAEALCRWIDPEQGAISPGKFIPVLEEQGLIWRLDLYMVEQVCRDYQTLVQAKRDMVPVSVNLSRKDINQPDLVYQIEKIARKYHVPREILNIEITESAFVRHQEKLSYIVSLFHDLGFQVWMDDFGTAYSSLGSLKDLKFDELKIDMSFLSSSTERARCIVRSVVRMAKEIGVQTLAEGVETREQYLFLREIGCEKIQGYYFGKPMDKLSFDRYCVEQHRVKEPLRWKNYYDALGRIDYQTDLPLCVIEDDGVRMRALYYNEAYRDVLRKEHVSSADAWMEEINSENSPVHAVHRQFASEQLRKRSGPQTMFYPSGDHYMELRGETVAHYENQYLYALHIRKIQLNQEPENQKNADWLKNLYYLPQDIAVMDLKKNTLFGIKSSNSDYPIGSGGIEIQLEQAFKNYCEHFIYFMDQSAYLRFFDLQTLREKVLDNKEEMLREVFRGKDQRGEYHWMLNLLLPLPGTDAAQLLLVTIDTGLSEQKALNLLNESVLPGREQTDSQGHPEEMSDVLLWRNQRNLDDEMLFWKDRDRRFVGANKSFLDYYGFSSVRDIYGRTDEDMHWHVEVEPFKSDELRVLKNGEIVHFALGKCIARGSERNILASKIPVYRDGKIIGLMGKFVDVDDLTLRLDKARKSESVDPVTGLANVKGVFDSFRSYLDALWTTGTSFAVLRLSNPEFDAFVANYGTEAGDRVLCHVGKLLTKVAGKSCVIGRMTGNYFSVLTQYETEAQVQQLAGKIRDRLGSVVRVDGLQCAVNLQTIISYLTPENMPEKKYIDVLAQIMYNLGMPENESED